MINFFFVKKIEIHLINIFSIRRCVENHPCEKYCYEDCGMCAVPVERNLQCGHTVTLECSQDYEKYLCLEKVSVTLEKCSHNVKKKCYELLEKVECTFPCEDRLECGHQCVKNCHKNSDPDHLEVSADFCVKNTVIRMVSNLAIVFHVVV